MFGSGSKPSLGLSISTSAASNTPNPFGTAAGGSLFGGSGSTAVSQPQQQGGLFGGAASQPSQGGGLFGTSTSQPSQGGGLFGSTTSQPGAAGLFGSATSQTASSGLFGAAATTQAPQGGLFGTTTSQQPSSGGLFGSASQPTQSGGLFGTPASQAASSGGLFGAVSSQSTKPGGLFSSMQSQPAQTLQGLFNPAQAPQPSTFLGGYGQNGTAKPAATLNLGQQPGLAVSSSARIDLDHLRPTTKFDQLTEELQREIVNLDTAVLNEINRCHEVSNLLPAIAATGSHIPNDVVYVTQKLEEVEIGLENDAADILYQKEQTVKKDATEARLCFREVDRLKMPAQYQTSVTGPTASVSSGVYGGHGLSGWWNHPQTLQRSIRGGPGAGSRSLQLPGDEDENDLAGGPSNLIEFFDRRTEEMKKALAENKSLLVEIEEFVMGVEGKIAAKQLELMGGSGRPNGIRGEEDQIGLLQYVFGEFERSLYEVADKVGGARDGVQELVMGQAGDIGQAHQRARR